MTPKPDAAWIREVLERHERPLTLYATRLLGDVERARDVVQEAFLRLCDQLNSGKQERAALAERVDLWLLTVCRNLCHDLHRKESRMTPLEEERAQRAACATATPAEAAERRDDVARVLDTLERLPEKQREVLRLKFQHGLSYAEISRVTRESQGNVGWLLHVGLKSLREKLAQGEIQGAEA